jgi:hypothetical protein
MAISNFDLTKGIDFTALSSASAGDHNSLVDAAVPYATDKGIVMVSNDTALNTPDVPNAAATTKWKNYIWIRRPHSTATNTTPIAYMWNENATSVATYLKWQRIPADTSTVDAALAALTLRVEDLEAVNVTLQALVNAANSNAATANTNASAAVSTANAANANALQAISDLDTPVTGVKARVTALEGTVAGHTTQIGNIQTQVTTNTNNITILQGIVTTSKYDSGTVALPAVGATTPLPHGLANIPFDFSCVLVCVTNDANTGILAGQLVQFESGVDAATAPIFLVRADTNYVYVTRSNQATLIFLKNITTGVLTQATSAANFSMRIIARSA